MVHRSGRWTIIKIHNYMYMGLSVFGYRISAKIRYGIQDDRQNPFGFDISYVLDLYLNVLHNKYKHNIMFFLQNMIMHTCTTKNQDSIKLLGNCVKMLLRANVI